MVLPRELWKKSFGDSFHSCTHAAPIKIIWNQITLLLSIIFCLYFFIEIVTSKNMQEYRFSLTIFTQPSFYLDFEGNDLFEGENFISLFLTLFHIKGVFVCCYVICYYHGVNFITFSLGNITYKAGELSSVSAISIKKSLQKMNESNSFTILVEGFAKGVVKKIFWRFLPFVHSCCTNKNSLRSNHLASKYSFLSLLLHRNCYFKKYARI